MNYKTLKTEQKGYIFIITYNNPPKNFMVARFLYEFKELMAKLENDPSVRVILLKSDNKDYFVGHSEMAELSTMISRAVSIPEMFHKPIVSAITRLHGLFNLFPFLEKLFLSSPDEKKILQVAPFISMRLFNAIQHSSKITIAAINGNCLGGGLELAMCFDFRFMSTAENVIIGQPEILVGMIPGYGGTQRMSRIIGPAKTLELQLTGEQLNAEQAEKIGLIYKALPEENFEVEVIKFAEKMSSRNPVTVKNLKKAVFKAGELPLHKGLFVELNGTLKSISSKMSQQKIKDYADLIEQQLILPDDKQLKPKEILKMMEHGNKNNSSD